MSLFDRWLTSGFVHFFFLLSLFLKIATRFIFQHSTLQTTSVSGNFLITSVYCAVWENFTRTSSIWNVRIYQNELWTSHIRFIRKKKEIKNWNGQRANDHSTVQCTAIMHVLLQGNWKFVVELLSTCRLCAQQIFTNETYRNRNAQQIMQRMGTIFFYCVPLALLRHQMDRTSAEKDFALNFLHARVEIIFHLLLNKVKV